MRDEKLFYVYIVADRSRVIYVGFTSDLYQRVLQHRRGEFSGFTSRYGCKRLVWYERYGTALDAIAREKQIKRWRRDKKEFLIELENPTWEDLSADWGLPISRTRDRFGWLEMWGREAGFSTTRFALRSK